MESSSIQSFNLFLLSLFFLPLTCWPFICAQSLNHTYAGTRIHMQCSTPLGIYELEFPPPTAPILSHPGMSGEWRCSFSGWHTPLHIWNAHRETLLLTTALSTSSGYLGLNWPSTVCGTFFCFKVQVQDMPRYGQLTLYFHLPTTHQIQERLD